MSENKTNILVSPDAMSTENELISEKLLEWTRTHSHSPAIYVTDIDDVGMVAPSFTTWADAGLILDALSMRGERYALEYRHQTQHGEPKFFCFISEDHCVNALGHAGPLAIRSAALAYIRSLP